MRILHTSDWHIGRQLHNVSLLDDQRHVLEQIIDILSARQIDVMIIAGDIYDRSVPPADAVALLDEFIDRVNVLGVPLILIAGNHDGPERLGFGARQLTQSGIHISGPLGAELKPVVLGDQFGPVEFYPLPYADPATVRSVLKQEVSDHEAAMQALTEKVRGQNPADRRSVVIAHCFLEGYAASESERPLSVGGVETVSTACFDGFDYVALGHLHGPQARGASHIRYSGSILKYSFSEATQSKSVTVVEMDASGNCVTECVELVPRHNLRVIEGKLDGILHSGLSDPNAEDYVMVRLEDRQAILDAMGKLRTVYPNALHLERPALRQAGERNMPNPDRLRQGEMPMFRDFFQQMSSDELDAAQVQVVAALLEKIHAGGDA